MSSFGTCKQAHVFYLKGSISLIKFPQTEEISLWVAIIQVQHLADGMLDLRSKWESKHCSHLCSGDLAHTATICCVLPLFLGDYQKSSGCFWMKLFLKIISEAQYSYCMNFYLCGFVSSLSCFILKSAVSCWLATVTLTYMILFILHHTPLFWIAVSQHKVTTRGWIQKPAHLQTLMLKLIRYWCQETGLISSKRCGSVDPHSDLLVRRSLRHASTMQTLSIFKKKYVNPLEFPGLLH